MPSVDAPGVWGRATLARESVETHFQPVIAVRRKSVVGVEALSRGREGDGRQIAPATLFDWAAAEGLLPQLDDLCRTKAVESFAPLHAADPELILFVNFHASTVEADAEEPDNLIRLVERLRVDPRNVAVEILESQFGDTARLRKAVDHYHDSGFLVALDDVGAGYSNLDRITYIKPDILKADRSLVRDIDRDYYKQEVFKAIVNLSERIGGWTIAEGVETQAEAIVVLDLGADMLQGFYFAPPDRIERDAELRGDMDRVQNIAADFKRYTLDKFRAAQGRREQRRGLTEDIVKRLEGHAPESFERELTEHLRRHPVIASACLLSESGTQISETVMNPRPAKLRKTVIFRPPAKGADHSFKEYYYVLTETAVNRFETHPYVPLPSGDLCITVSALFRNLNRETFILCLHIDADRT